MIFSQHTRCNGDRFTIEKGRWCESITAPATVIIDAVIKCHWNNWEGDYSRFY